MLQESKKAEIIVLQYYDGVTEGFALSIATIGSAYFKMIAWDDDQDQRLFIASPVDLSIFESIVTMFSGTASQHIQVLLPKWSSMDDRMKQGVNEAIQNSRVNLNKKRVLVLGAHIDSDGARVYPVSDSIGDLKRAMKQPENLAHWIGRLK